MAHLAFGAKEILKLSTFGFYWTTGLIEIVHTYFIKTVNLTFQVINNWLGQYVSYMIGTLWFYCNSTLNKTVRLIENRIPMWSFKLGHPKLVGFLHENKENNKPF